MLIAGGGVAGLETLLALRALAPDRLDITILAPELKFVNRSMSAQQPFKVQRGRGLRLEDTAAELGAHWHRGALDRVVHAQHRVVTRDRESLSYDMLVLALGARPQREWHAEGVLTYRGGRDGPNYRMLLHQLREGRVAAGGIRQAGWGELAAAALRPRVDDRSRLRRAQPPRGGAEPDHARGGATRGLRTPRQRGYPRNPGRIRGDPADGQLRKTELPGRLEITPGHRSLAVDRIVTEPRLVGPSLRGIPSEHEGFIQTDAHGRVPGLDDVFAAGDATTFPVKQGGLAAQQADAVAEAIAAAAGAQIDPQPFRPVLRGTLLTGGPARYLRADISGGAGDDSTVSDEALWWPPNKLCGRYLAPYLSSKTGEAADVMPQDAGAIQVDTPLDAERPDTRGGFGELSDLPPRL